MAAVVPAVIVSPSCASRSSTRTCSVTYLFPRNSQSFSKSPSSCLSSSVAAFSTKIPLSHSSSFTRDFFIQKYQFSPQLASKVAFASARMKSPQNPDLLLSFLKQTGFSNAHLERIVKHHSQVLSLCVETNVKPKLKLLHDLGLSAGEVTQIVSRDFNILRRAENTIMHRISVLKGVLGSNDNVIKLIKKRPNLFYANPEKTLVPNIEFLKSCGVQLQQIDSLIYVYHQFFFQNPENVRRGVRKADEMGVPRSSRMFIYAVEAISRMPDETLELKQKNLQDLGFSDDDILRLFRSSPVVLSLSANKINEVREVLLGTGKYDISCIVNYPAAFTYSVEKRYKPRLGVLKALEERSLITKWPSLSTLCTMTGRSFFERFVAPNVEEVGKDYMEEAA